MTAKGEGKSVVFSNRVTLGISTTHSPGQDSMLSLFLTFFLKKGREIEHEVEWVGSWGKGMKMIKM